MAPLSDSTGLSYNRMIYNILLSYNIQYRMSYNIMSYNGQSYVIMD